jgi:hypothetical protein
MTPYSPICRRHRHSCAIPQRFPCGGTTAAPARVVYSPPTSTNQRPIAFDSYAAIVATVDPDDDSICRWVVWHYRYDPDRSERRNVVVAAFDNRHEFDADIEKRAARLRACKERGEDVDPAEHVSGLMQEPGYRRMQRNAHLLRRAMEHGAVPACIEDLDLPSSVGFIRAERLP